MFLKEAFLLPILFKLHFEADKVNRTKPEFKKIYPYCTNPAIYRRTQKDKLDQAIFIFA